MFRIPKLVPIDSPKLVLVDSPKSMVFDRIRSKVWATLDAAAASGALIRCKTCRRDLSAADFDRRRAMLTCRTCCRKATQLRRMTSKTTAPFAVKLRSLRAGAFARGLTYSLTVEWAYAQWERQRGRCAYTFMPLDLFRHQRGPLECSFDRVDSALGYDPENVVLCAYAFNIFKGSMPKDEAIWLFEAMAAGRRDQFPEWHADPMVALHLTMLRKLDVRGARQHLLPPGAPKPPP